MIFATNLSFLPGETVTALSSQAIDSRGFVYPLTVDYVGKVPGYDWLSTIIVVLPQDYTINGDLLITVRLPGQQVIPWSLESSLSLR